MININVTSTKKLTIAINQLIAPNEPANITEDGPITNAKIIIKKSKLL